MSRWYRAYEGTVTDAKLAEAAAVAEVSRSVGIAAWHCLLESAAAVNNCGSFETSARRIAIVLCEPIDRIEALFAAYAEIGLIANGAVMAWKKRQHESDSSTERTRKWREKKRQESADCDSDGDASDGDETSRDAPETEAETEEESSKDDSTSDDAPSLRPEHVFEGYQKLAAEMGRPVPRDFTPERRQLTRARVAQYSLDDFHTVFGKCRDSPFLRGDRGRSPLSYDWIMKKANFQKTLEGNYDG